MKQLKIYYYSVGSNVKILNSDFLKDSLRNFNQEKYLIEEKEEWIFYVYIPKIKNLELIPKVWKKDNFSAGDLEPLKLEEDETIFDEIFCILNTNENNLYQNSIWILSSVKAWKSETLSFRVFLNEILKWKAFSIEPIVYKNKDKFFDNINKLKWFKFSIAAWKFQWMLWINQDIKGALAVKDYFWWDEITIDLSSKDSLDKVSIWQFRKNNRTNFSEVPKISIDEAWNTIEREIDNIRFIWIIEIDSSWKNIEKKEIFSKMEADFSKKIIEMKKDLT